MKLLFIGAALLLASSVPALAQKVDISPDPANPEPSATAITRMEAEMIHRKQMQYARSFSSGDTVDMARPYKGLYAPENDGVKTNQYRNLNTNSNYKNLPPNNGGNRR